MVSVTKQGISFSYYGDEITLRWPWVYGDRFHSSLHATDFNHFRDYWIKVGQVGEQAFRIRSSGKDLLGVQAYEVLSAFAKAKYPGEYVVVLADIDLSSKDDAFWRKLPKDKAAQFTKDFVVLRCKDRAQMLDISTSTEPGFASAYAFQDGILVDTNLWGEEV